MYNFHRIILFSELCPPSLPTVHRNQQSEEKQIPNYQVAEVLLHFSRKVNSLKKNNYTITDQGQHLQNFFKVKLRCDFNLSILVAPHCIVGQTVKTQMKCGISSGSTLFAMRKIIFSKRNTCLC